MGKSAKFKEDLLLDAVIQYSGVVKTSIVATELAKWARNNIEGLADVQAYHFTRPVKNPKTGKLEKKLCAQRIEELNVARDIRRRENTNVLLSSANIERFYELDARTQRRTIGEMRDIVSEYIRTNNCLRKQNDYIKSHVNAINEKMDTYELLLKAIKKKQTHLENRVAYVLRKVEDEQVRLQLEKMGIKDGEFDLVKYTSSLEQDISELFHIDEAIRKYQKEMTKIEINDDEEQEVLLPNENYSSELTDF